MIPTQLSHHFGKGAGGLGLRPLLVSTSRKPVNHTVTQLPHLYLGEGRETLMSAVRRLWGTMGSESPG